MPTGFIQFNPVGGDMQSHLIAISLFDVKIVQHVVYYDGESSDGLSAFRDRNVLQLNTNLGLTDFLSVLRLVLCHDSDKTHDYD